MCAARLQTDDHLELKIYVVRALHAVPGWQLQLGWLKETHDILWQASNQFPFNERPDVCALWARLCCLEGHTCTQSGQGIDSRADSAPGQMLWSAAVENGTFASMFRIGCMQLGVSSER